MGRKGNQKEIEGQTADNHAKSLFVEFQLNTPLLRSVCQDVPNVTIHLEQELATDKTATVLTIKVLGEDISELEAFERAFANDHTVESIERFGVESECERRYQLRVQREYSPYWKWTEQGMVLIEATRCRTEWCYQMRLCDRTSLTEFVEYCRDREWEFRLIQLKESSDETASRDRYGMTHRQRNLIDKALEQGFFDIPRRITMVQLAEGIGISDQAASERLRRGLRNHLETTA